MMEDWTESPAELHRKLDIATGCGVRVGLLDTGVASMHPALGDCIVKNYEVAENSPFEVCGLPEGKDYGEHGTACADIIHQFAPDAQLYSVCVAGVKRKGLLKRLVAGLRYALKQRWDVVNISLGTRIESDEFLALCQQAQRQGQIVIAAKHHAGDEIGFPAAFPCVIGVDMDHFASPLDVRFAPDRTIEVQANGIYVRAARPGGSHHFYTGSSFACPHVTALASRLRQFFPEMDARRFRAALRLLGSAGSA